MTATGAPRSWKCPGCGAEIALPVKCLAAARNAAPERLDQLARALCGCWVVNLPEDQLTQLLGAVVDRDDLHEETMRWVMARRF